MFAVFKRDFRATFTSPTGYVFCAIFLAATGLFFYLENITQSHNDLAGLFAFMLLVSMFTIPGLTMRLMSEEYKQKTDQLLFTAPIQSRHIVLGKFLSGLMVYVLLLIGTLLYPLVIAMTGNLAGTMLLGNYFALLCFGAAFISVGLFISTLTENQLVSFVGALGIFLALYLVDIFSTSTTVIWVRTLVDWISMFRRFDAFTQGIFAFNDVVFYISVCALFLFLSNRVLEKKRWA